MKLPPTNKETAYSKMRYEELLDFIENGPKDIIYRAKLLAKVMAGYEDCILHDCKRLVK